MAQVWLKETGYPVVAVAEAYDEAARTFTMTLTTPRSKGGKVWEFPFSWALIGTGGRVLAEGVRRIRSEREVISVSGVDRPVYASLNRGYSFYGKVLSPASGEALHLQARTDPDAVNRYLAFYGLADLEKARLIADPALVPSDRFTDLFMELLSDGDLIERLGGLGLTIFESVEDEALAHRYRALFEARQRLLHAIATLHQEALLSLYESFAAGPAPVDTAGRIRAIKRRQVKNLCLEILATLDNVGVHHLLLRQFREAVTASDRLNAFRLILGSSSRDREAIFAEFLEGSAGNLVAWEAFLSTVAGSNAPDLVDLVGLAEKSRSFRVDQANDQRALYVRFAMNRKVSLQTAEGRDCLRRILEGLARVNETSTVRALQVFGHLDLMEAEYHLPLAGLLAGLLKVFHPDGNPVSFNTVRRLLLGAPRALAAYEAKFGRVEGLRTGGSPEG